MPEEKSSKAAAAEKPKPAAPASGGSDETKLFGALCYIPIFAISLIVSLLILLTERKENKFLKFHATQSLIFMVVSAVVVITLFVIMWFGTVVVSMVTYGIGGLVCCGLEALMLLAYLVIWLFLAWQAYQGIEYEIPVIGKFARKYV
ncbi:DUF4870 domain-containing protein [Candidatus Micrarchaeota archaeon]|nr:DUF4870 domain-containing protein [Candidatus Micrarchaeota archaeon]